MSTVLHPVGPRSARVYWRRRLVLLALAVVVLLVLGNLVRGWVAPGEADEQPEEPAPAATGTTTPAACPTGSLAVTAGTPARVHGPEDLVHLAVTVTNTGTIACTVDLGAGAVEAVVTSGSDRVWSSLDCPADPPAPSRLLLLAPEAREATEVTWARERSAADCPGGLPAPRAGTYRATVTVESTTSEAAVFELQ